MLLETDQQKVGDDWQVHQLRCAIVEEVQQIYPEQDRTQCERDEQNLSAPK